MTNTKAYSSRFLLFFLLITLFSVTSVAQCDGVNSLYYEASGSSAQVLSWDAIPGADMYKLGFTISNADGEVIGGSEYLTSANIIEVLNDDFFPPLGGITDLAFVVDCSTGPKVVTNFQFARIGVPTDVEAVYLGDVPNYGCSERVKGKAQPLHTYLSYQSDQLECACIFSQMAHAHFLAYQHVNQDQDEPVNPVGFLAQSSNTIANLTAHGEVASAVLSVFGQMNYSAINDFPSWAAFMEAHVEDYQGIWGNFQDRLCDPGGDVFKNTIEDLILEGFNIFPNPTHNFVRLETTEAVRYEIFDTNGERVSFGISQGEEIEVANFPAGTYMMKVIAPGNQSSTSKFIKL